MRNFFILFLFIFSIKVSAQTPPKVNPLFRNSIVSTNIDFIKATDIDALVNVQFLGRETKEMPDSRNDNLFDNNTFIFKANFSDNTAIEIWCHSSFGNTSAAKEYADKLAPRLGKLPDFMRNNVNHVVVHKGDAGAFAESEANFFVLYSDNMDVRIENNDLEETVFHESVHASLDLLHLNKSGWMNAQTTDGNFITNYASENVFKEDFAETMLFVYTMVRYPERLTTDVKDWVNTHLPNRYNYIVDNVLPKTLSINDFVADSAVSVLNIYPNPSDKEVQVVLKNSTNSKAQIQIYTITGKLVKSIDLFKESNKIDVSDLTTGVYYVHVKGYKLAKLLKK
ncbi:T9SS type A sorting domain-containing protein [uncultured Polaribacter sp.]|uniref:T9SS type A sorting domain-containing protein n=1 Tax=uncultured Polaribacter sp. TaxID=174711 RepID=UPI0026330FF0|nr:T9SS type A sorting domain-containing protein [uncultured Polaribacter sp.]